MKYYFGGIAPLKDGLINAFVGIFIGCCIGTLSAIVYEIFPNLGIVFLTASISAFSAFYLWM